MKRKIFGITISTLILIGILSTTKVYAADEINYREIVTNISTVENESNVISSVFGEGKLRINDIYIPKKMLVEILFLLSMDLYFYMQKYYLIMKPQVRLPKISIFL